MAAASVDGRVCSRSAGGVGPGADRDAAVDGGLPTCVAVRDGASSTQSPQSFLWPGAISMPMSLVLNQTASIASYTSLVSDCAAGLSVALMVRGVGTSARGEALDPLLGQFLSDSSPLSQQSLRPPYTPMTPPPAAVQQHTNTTETKGAYECAFVCTVIATT